MQTYAVAVTVEYTVVYQVEAESIESAQAKAYELEVEGVEPARHLGCDRQTEILSD